MADPQDQAIDEYLASLEAKGLRVTNRAGMLGWFKGKIAKGFSLDEIKKMLEDKAYDFINAWLDHGSAKGLLENFGYAHSNDAAMAMISNEELAAGDVDPVTGTLLSQVPIDPAMRDRMTQEFELIKSGF